MVIARLEMTVADQASSVSRRSASGRSGLRLVARRSVRLSLLLSWIALLTVAACASSSGSTAAAPGAASATTPTVVAPETGLTPTAVVVPSASPLVASDAVPASTPVVVPDVDGSAVDGAGVAGGGAVVPPDGGELLPDPFADDERWQCEGLADDEETIVCLAALLRALVAGVDVHFELLNRMRGQVGLSREDFVERYQRLSANNICRRTVSATHGLRCDIELIESIQSLLTRLSWLEVDPLPLRPDQMWGTPADDFEAVCEVRVEVDSSAVDWVGLHWLGLPGRGAEMTGVGGIELSGAAGLGPVQGSGSSEWVEDGAMLALEFDLVGTHYFDRLHNVMAGIWFGEVTVDGEPQPKYGYWWLRFDDGVNGVGDIRSLDHGVVGQPLAGTIAPCS